MVNAYKHEIVDRDTGEVSPALVLKRTRVKWRFVMWSLNGLGGLATDGDAVLSHWRILAWLAHKSDSAGVIKITQAEIADGLDLSAVSVNQGIKFLSDKKYIIKDGVGRYILSPNHFHRGGRMKGDSE
jgi:hypothetical protein